MSKIFPFMLALAMLALPVSTGPAQAEFIKRHEVHGVGDGDFLKLREGPGVGYSVIVGLPNGTVLRVRGCERLGHARWCEVSLDRARALRGYVSATYLRKL